MVRYIQLLSTTPFPLQLTWPPASRSPSYPVLCAEQNAASSEASWGPSKKARTIPKQNGLKEKTLFGKRLSRAWSWWWLMGLGGSPGPDPERTVSGGGDLPKGLLFPRAVDKARL